ncbi:MAG: hypothetical protein PSV35_00785, partial [bacterium]|nr:hypothetical protein [bacterium]
MATLTTKRLMPFITLALDDYRISVDTPQSSLIVVQNKKNNIPEKKYLAKEQIIEINKQAHQGGEFYNWELSPFIELSKGTEDELDKLPKYQHRFTEITKLLDSVSEIVENYRSFLQLKSFQQFLIKCLNKIKDEYHNLGRHIDNIDTLLSQDQLINRNMTSILGPMSQDLMKGLSSFSAAFSDFEHIICDPNFTEQQKQLLTTKIKGIDQQFTALFNEDSGVIHSITQSSIDDINSLPIKIIPRTCPALIEAAIPKANPALLVDEQKLDTSRPIKTPQKNSDKLAPINNEPQLTLDFKTANNPIQTANLMIDMEDKISSPTNKKPSYRAIHEEMYVDVKHVVALRQLIERCYEALSYQSKHSEKGYLLNNLLHLIENKPHFSESNMTQAMNELARITLSYRRTFFFQAAYGETRSGKIFISAIKYPKLNQILPVASLMFGSEIDVSQESDEYIIKRCQNIKESNHWPETA